MDPEQKFKVFINGYVMVKAADKEDAELIVARAIDERLTDGNEIVSANTDIEAADELEANDEY